VVSDSRVVNAAVVIGKDSDLQDGGCCVTSLKLRSITSLAFMSAAVEVTLSAANEVSVPTSLSIVDRDADTIGVVVTMETASVAATGELFTSAAVVMETAGENETKTEVT